ncbi:MAG: T9SS type A sorting domain-containing protein [Bacteroidetes bacterium]|nr:T9SS type A sorting domain-containing protein [Bacteroidota bacterium]
MPVNIKIIAKRISVLSLILFHFTVKAQLNCENDSSLLIPIVDLQTDSYLGFQGGLYPDGSNTIPVAHADSGLAIAQAIMPINFDGEIDTTYGKVVMVGLGNGSAGKSFNKFLGAFYEDINTDSCVRLLNACMENYSLHDMIAPDADDVYWKDVNDFFQTADLKKKQVAAVWLQAVAFEDTFFTAAQYVDTLTNTYVEVIRKLKDQFINLKLIYITGLQYGGYSDTLGVHINAYAEPAPYFNDFAIKAAIQKQIEGDTLLAYSGVEAPAAWVAWGPNIWADGRNLRAYDNLRWLCPGDYDAGQDGFLLSGSGQQKVADKLVAFFTTEPTVTPWIYGLPYDWFTEIEDEVDPEENDSLNVPDDAVIWISPNPVKGVLKFVINLETDEKADIYIFNTLGQNIIDGAFYKIAPRHEFSIKLTENARGIYILSVFVEGRVYNKLFYLDN